MKQGQFRRSFGAARVFALASSLTLLASACLGGNQPTTQNRPSPGTTVAPPKENTKITFQSWVGTSPTMKKLVANFESQYPTIDVELRNVPAEEATQKYLTQFAGGTAPDVAFVDMSAVADFASRNALVDLTPYISQSKVANFDDFVGAWKEAATYEGKQYAMPFDGETTGLFYRTDLFEQAGVTEPPKTWEEFEAAAQRLTDPAKKQYGFILFASESAYYWYPWLWQAGGNLFNNETDAVEFNTPEAKQAAEFYVGLRKYSPPDFFNSNSWDGRVAFATGKVAMYEAGSWLAGELINFPKAKGKWATAPMPEGPAGCATTIAGDSLVIFNQTQNADAAWLWIEYLTSPEIMRRWTVGEPGSTLLPPRASLLNDPTIFEEKPILKGFAENMKCGVTNTIDTPKWGRIEEVLNEKLGAAIYGDISPEQALDEAAQEAQKVLED